jgi:hypothetical protein
MWIQQDETPLHFGREMTEFLSDSYYGRWLGRGGPVPWSAQSPDLSPLDFSPGVKVLAQWQSRNCSGWYR